MARIDELFAEIAEGEAALERARQGLDTWRRALLKAAVTGELTRDWREANRPTETGADLLARIRAEREASAGKPSRKRGALRTLTARHFRFSRTARRLGVGPTWRHHVLSAAERHRSERQQYPGHARVRTGRTR